MALGPIQVLMVAFPGNRFNGEIVPELERLIEAGTITLVDGLLAMKGSAGELDLIEFVTDDPDADPAIARLAGLMQQVDSLVSDADVAELAATLEPNSSAAILVFEHTWAKPFHDAVVGSGGVLAADFLVPGLVVDQLLDELAAITD